MPETDIRTWKRKPITGGELYISRIIDEEMKSDDLFLR